MDKQYLSRPETERVTLSAQVVREALWLDGDQRLGTQPGMFITRLWQLFAAADPENRQKLAAEWPEYASAFSLLHFQVWGRDYLRALAVAEAQGAEPPAYEYLDLAALVEQAEVRRA